MFKSFKFNQKLEQNSQDVSGEEKNMMKFAEDLKNSKKPENEEPSEEFLEKLESHLIKEFSLTKMSEKKESNWWKLFAPVTYPVAALALAYFIYLGFNGKAEVPVDPSVQYEVQVTDFASDLLAYESSLSDLEEELYLLSNLTELSENVDLNDVVVVSY